MKKKNLAMILFAVVALLLLALCLFLLRSRPLLSCFPELAWTEVTGEHIVLNNSQERPFPITTAELLTTLVDVRVRPTRSFSDWADSSILIWVHAEHNTILLLVGQDGSVYLYNTVTGQSFCWKSTGGNLYDQLLPYTYPTSG